MSDLYSELWGSSSDEEAPASVSFNAMSLARYFKKKLDSAIWSGFAMVNLTALARQFKQWQGKIDEEHIKACIDKYMSDPDVRGKNPGWTDFLYRLEQIHGSLTVVSTDDKWDRIEREYLAKYGDDDA